MSYYFHAEARAGHLASVVFHERRRAGLGSAYLDAFDAVMTRIVQNPHGYRVEHPRDIRRAGLDRVPFTVRCRDTPAGIQILAVAHYCRQPLYWADRREAREPQHGFIPPHAAPAVIG